MNFIYRLRNDENGYTWGEYQSADDAFDAIEADPDWSRASNIRVIREQV